MLWCSCSSSSSTFSMLWCASFWSKTNDNSTRRRLETNSEDAKLIYSRKSSIRDSKCRSISMRCLICIAWSLFLSHSHWLAQTSRRLRSNSYTSICRLNSRSSYQKKRARSEVWSWCRNHWRTQEHYHSDFCESDQIFLILLWIDDF
jgi:hypothetical protein